jgi:hypothetical protein
MNPFHVEHEDTYRYPQFEGTPWAVVAPRGRRVSYHRTKWMAEAEATRRNGGRETELKRELLHQYRQLRLYNNMNRGKRRGHDMTHTFMVAYIWERIDSLRAQIKEVQREHH